MKAFPTPRAVQVYNPGLRALHWLMAALIFVALPLGVWASQLPSGRQRSEILFFHKSIGMTVLCLVALRIVWRLIVGAPAYAEPLGRLIHAAARCGHFALYALMIAMPVSGYVGSAAGGHEAYWFGVFTFPNLLPKDKAVAEAAPRGALHIRVGDRVRSRRASRRRGVACRRQARHDIDAHVAGISAGLKDREIVIGSALRMPACCGKP